VWKRGAILCALALVLTAGARLIWRGPTGSPGPRDTSRPELAELVEAVGRHRFFEARLTGGFLYGPVQEVARSGVSTPLTPDVRIAIARIEKKAAVSADSDAAWAVLGSSYLVSGEPDKALEVLEAAVATSSPNPRWLSDLSAAYLIEAQRRDRFELFPKALATAERACRLDTTLPEPAFNRALALESLHLTAQAEAAWHNYRLLDPDSPWGHEALTRATKLKEQSTQDERQRESIAQVLEVSLRDEHPDVAVFRPFRQQLRSRIETTFIPGWAENELSGNRERARRELQQARKAAEVLVEAGGDLMPLDGVHAIVAVLQRDDSSLANHLARAHLALRDVIRLFDDGAVAKANDTFQSVERDFAAARSPYAHWSAIYGAVAHFAARRYDTAREALAKSNSEVIDKQYLFLSGRRKWLLGLLLSDEGHYMATSTQYQAALADLRAVGETESAAAVTVLLAEDFGKLGVPREAWRYELSALAQLPQIAPIRRKHNVVQCGGLLALEEGLPGAALHFQHAVISLSSGIESRASSLAEGYYHRAQTDERLGDVDAAKQDLALATGLLSHITDSSLRSREEADVSAAIADVYRGTEPAEAIAAASRAIDFFRDSGGEFKATALYVARARAQLANKEVDLAEADLTIALQHFEEQRNRMQDRQLRGSFFRDGWDAFAEMVGLQVVWRHDPAAALDYAERARARTLLEGIARTPRAEPTPLSTLQRSLPSRTAALFFVTLEDRILVWTVRNRDVHLSQLPIGVAKLRTEVERLRWLLAQTTADDQRLRLQLEALFLQLVEPAVPFVGGADTLVILPDGPLHALPFAALMNPRTGRYLVEDYVLLTAPSLSTMARHANSKPTSPFDPSLRALVVGNPDRQAAAEDSWLPPLPFSEDEAANVAALYRDSILLKGQGATKRAFLGNLNRAAIVHYAGHALVNEQEPLLSRLLLARDATSGDDGSLFVSELSQLRLNRTKLVVLAGCSTGAGMIGSGEGVFSLARPFLEAGASTVVATLWDIPDRSAALLFQEFHRRLTAGQTPAVALSYVQREFVHHSDVTLRPPAHWAWAVPIGALD
jgi:CHAT domain-containing protein/tetratricopeptide (TPR) repeat protein